ETNDKMPDLRTSDSALVDAWRRSGRPEPELAKLLGTTLPDLPDDARDRLKSQAWMLRRLSDFYGFASFYWARTGFFGSWQNSRLRSSKAVGRTTRPVH